LSCTSPPSSPVRYTYGYDPEFKKGWRQLDTDGQAEPEYGEMEYPEPRHNSSFMKVRFPDDTVAPLSITVLHYNNSIGMKGRGRGRGGGGARGRGAARAIVTAAPARPTAEDEEDAPLHDPADDEAATDGDIERADGGIERADGGIEGADDSREGADGGIEGAGGGIDADKNIEKGEKRIEKGKKRIENGEKRKKDKAKDDPDVKFERYTSKEVINGKEHVVRWRWNNPKGKPKNHLLQLLHDNKTVFAVNEDSLHGLS
jgi:hypothetical protein